MCCPSTAASGSKIATRSPSLSTNRDLFRWRNCAKVSPVIQQSSFSVPPRRTCQWLSPDRVVRSMCPGRLRLLHQHHLPIDLQREPPPRPRDDAHVGTFLLEAPAEQEQPRLQVVLPLRQVE